LLALCGIIGLAVTTAPIPRTPALLSIGVSIAAPALLCHRLYIATLPTRAPPALLLRWLYIATTPTPAAPALLRRCPAIVPTPIPPAVLLGLRLSLTGHIRLLV